MQTTGQIVVEMQRLKNTNKKGVISPDNQGCYTMCIGGLDAFNSVGEYYAYEPAKHFFNEQSVLTRKIERGVLRAEYGHPTLQDLLKNINLGSVSPSIELQLKRLFADRVLKIEPTKVCGTWRKIALLNQPLQDNKGKSIIPIMGTIYPSGPYGEALKKQFESSGENVCFSIRCFADKTLSPQGYTVKAITHVVTWDYVLEPGIYNAEKLISPTLEEFKEEMSFKANELIDVIKNMDTRELAATECDLESISEFKDKLIDIQRTAVSYHSNLHNKLHNRTKLDCLNW